MNDENLLVIVKNCVYFGLFLFLNMNWEMFWNSLKVFGIVIMKKNRYEMKFCVIVFYK